MDDEIEPIWLRTERSSELTESELMTMVKRVQGISEIAKNQSMSRVAMLSRPSDSQFKLMGYQPNLSLIKIAMAP